MAQAKNHAARQSRDQRLGRRRRWRENGREAAPGGRSYDLKFNVDKPKTGAASTATIDIPKPFASLPADQQTVEVPVKIETDDFTINGPDQPPVVVPRTGPPEEHRDLQYRAEEQRRRRDPRVLCGQQPHVPEDDHHAPGGPAVGWHASDAVRYQGPDHVQRDEPAAAQDEHPINLMIIKKEAGYQFILQGVGTTRAFPNLSETQIAELVAQTRDMFTGARLHAGRQPVCLSARRYHHPARYPRRHAQDHGQAWHADVSQAVLWPRQRPRMRAPWAT